MKKTNTFFHYLINFFTFLDVYQGIFADISILPTIY